MTAPVAIDNWEPGSRPRRIRDCVAAAFGFEPHRLIGRARDGDLVRVRHLAMWVVKQCCADMSYPMIGRVFGMRDHSTILHGIRATEVRFERDLEFAALGRFIADSIGTQKGGFVFDDAMRARVEAAIAAMEKCADEPAPAPTPPTRVRESTVARPRNDFTIGDDVAGMGGVIEHEDMMRAGTKALCAAIVREGVWR